MLELTRCVRFCVNDHAGSTAVGGGWGSPDNTFAAYPSMRGMGRYYEIEVRCRGVPTPSTGYFLNIKQIDQAVRSAAIPIVELACREHPERDPALTLAEIAGPVNALLGGVVTGVRWRLTPYYSIEMSPPTAAPPVPPRVLMRQQFEFAASHRLHCAGMSDAENRAMFGKCNNPSGHGHNYRVEACVDSPLTRDGAKFSLAELERTASKMIVERFDHKNLSTDSPEFDVTKGGLNPSVENIARVCFELLAPTVSAACPEAMLRSVTVWETDKTWCTYPAGEVGGGVKP